MIQPGYHQGPEQVIVGGLHLVVADAVEQCSVDELRANQPKLALAQACKYLVVCDSFIIKLEKRHASLMLLYPSAPSLDEQAYIFGIAATAYHLDAFPLPMHLLDYAHRGTTRFVLLLLDKHATKIAFFLHMGVCQGGKIWMLTTKNQPSHRNGVSQNALLGNCMYFIFRQMTFLRQNFAENIKKHMQILIPQGNEREYDNKKVSILLNNGVPMGLQFSITGIGIVMLQSANNALGTIYVAAFTASMRIKYLFTCVFENLGMAMATYCGQNIGAGKLDRVELGVKAAIKVMVVYFIFTFAIIYPFANNMMMLFVDSGEVEVVNLAAQFMRIANYFFPCLGLLTIFRYSIQGLGYSNFSMLSGVMEMIARCGVSLWLVPAFAWYGVCYGDPVAWVMADLFLIPAFVWLYKHLGKKLKQH